MIRFLFLFFFCMVSLSVQAQSRVTLGIDRLLMEEEFSILLKNKQIGLITNQSAINCQLKTTAELLMDVAKREGFEIKAIFAPEHGFYGDVYANGAEQDRKIGSIPVFSLHGTRRRPTAVELEGINLLIFDIQDIGSRSYSYISTLFTFMEEAAKYKIDFLVLDRPNPLGGNLIDGLIVEKKWSSFFGYIDIPYCHGMTVAELAELFKAEYQEDCSLRVIPMKGWTRTMTFQDTGLVWIPTSPQIPEMDTPFFYPVTGILGHLSFASIGIGYTLPFKIVGAPWIEGEKFAKEMNQLGLPGVSFHPFYFRPFFGMYKQKPCQGVKIAILNPQEFLPITTGYALMGMIKSLYPGRFQAVLEDLMANVNKQATFHKLNGKEEVLKIIAQEKYFIWKLKALCNQDRDNFAKRRKKYLIASYAG
ncbi:MAG: DUF1343 domain-containing protein [Chlamydiia bacterium]|nr:DUF1343 domain-containing protein [Chlamydiia bacterium]